ncbi:MULTISPECIES: hypothetical protein [unclassified Mucilaginibacter]|uniref:hypothetical protein n=1 Tax=unclassified Mucilaginibacter TaxID=2617802 RepID=UPI002AC9E678|nr:MULTISPECIES: hypothetical protein [unclassified Mucilaginibacter]MEB0263307.1 hypothetical protein [Mucilaginibacter sp. 10I4]MEB0278286.1 hypothetical protein [Mucilaginibacter sp. 10B2]MEB0301215.1 hypothetical protein [Mucilaginibacter sp. 5C4]WPX23932.1 hypothetical protein RHM67_01400 [Mucilaginibacter sp. 5C4]
MLLSAYLFFELLAFITSVVRYKALKHNRYIYFIPYLFFILIYEYGSIENWFIFKQSNLWITNITLFIFFLFYSIFIYGLIETVKFKEWIRRLIVLTIICSAANMAFLQGFWGLDTITILLQFAILISITCLYFYELMNLTGKELKVLRIPGFWLNTGLLFFCLGQFLFFSSFAYMAYLKIYEYSILHHVVANIANAILYSFLTISFLCIRTKN